MATFLTYAVPSGAAATTAAGTGASTGEIVLYKNALFLFSVTGSTGANIKFGNAGMPAAAATDFLVPNGTVVQFDLGTAYDRIRVFAAATATYSIQILSRS
jgi:hypothetical protein